MISCFHTGNIKIVPDVLIVICPFAPVVCVAGVLVLAPTLVPLVFPSLELLPDGFQLLLLLLVPGQLFFLKVSGPGPAIFVGHLQQVDPVVHLGLTLFDEISKTVTGGAVLHLQTHVQLLVILPDVGGELSLLLDACVGPLLFLLLVLNLLQPLLDCLHLQKFSLQSPG